MTATIADYSWWAQWRPDWAEAYCVTVLTDISADHVIAALNAEPTDRVRGADALIEYTVKDWPDGYDPLKPIIGVTDIGSGGALIAEINGFVGVTERILGPLSPGRTIVSHFANINAVHRFHWWRDGRLLVDVDLLFPAERVGAEPDSLIDELRGVGIPLDDDPESVAAVDLRAAGFALAERVTGVACTPALFDAGEYLIAAIDIPSGEEQQRYGEALRRTWRHPAAW
jgi:hypothetical protein